MNNPTQQAVLNSAQASCGTIYVVKRPAEPKLPKKLPKLLPVITK
jgi:hypothetical protein